MAPKMKLPQRRKSVRELEENVRKKRQAAQSSTAPTPASVSAQGPPQSSLSPSKNPLSDRKVETGKNIAFGSLKKRALHLQLRLKTKDGISTAPLRKSPMLT